MRRSRYRHDARKHKGTRHTRFAAAGVATLSIIPEAAMGFFVTLFLFRRWNGANKREP